MKILLMVPMLAVSLCAQVGDFKACSNRTLNGAYGYTIAGSRTIPVGPNAGQIEQAIGVGIRQYDGEGNFTQVDTTKGAQTAAAVDVFTTGTYSIKPNCTGTALVFVPSLPNPIEVRFVVVDNGKEIRWIVLSPAPTLISGSAIRL